MYVLHYNIRLAESKKKSQVIFSKRTQIWYGTQNYIEVSLRLLFFNVVQGFIQKFLFGVEGGVALPCTVPHNNYNYYASPPQKSIERTM